MHFVVCFILEFFGILFFLKAFYPNPHEDLVLMKFVYLMQGLDVLTCTILLATKFYTTTYQPLFLIVVQCQPRLNHQTQPFWVKGIWLVPNSQTLIVFCIGAFGSVTVGIFWFWATLLLGPLKQVSTVLKWFPSNWDMVLTPFRPPMSLNWSTSL